MRKLQRPTAPDCLIENTRHWTETFITARQQNAAHKFSWRSQPCYRTIRTHLVDMTQAHCAFCDGSVGAESLETIEHFRPKSRFPELAYRWDNLFLCCNACQAAKGEHFDDKLLKPDHDDYHFHRYFVNNYRTGELEPNPAATTEDQERARTTLALYRLNSPMRKKLRLDMLKYFNRRDENDSIDDFHYRFFLEE